MQKLEDIARDRKRIDFSRKPDGSLGSVRSVPVALSPHEANAALIVFCNARDALVRCKPVIEAVLAAQGDHADPALIDLQHCMASLLPAPAESNPQQPITTSP